ncbi:MULTISPECIES: entericidin A/B family lipoprotein [Pseudidiomarina]|uniref:Entericidin EcnA/B family n=2 Tax=Pseudidiomarina TaxID=2800384 RepID=A0A0K6GWX9_9GAMM|nr:MULTISPECIES: entericidin A/B family lipoprotein [Pseudidiomarina]RUO49696.1 entericidin, EcnA/B family [Pseudidiomarina donghaiensis]CUA83065.1 Entericidin EcnA/B family [Pseudidiomarina woesei]SFV21686.1 Entericidin EcnA/B family protein [Pseudidiomarina donghaiensis]
MKIKYFFMLLVALGVSGCATVEGIGKDLEKAGEAIQKESRDQSE